MPEFGNTFRPVAVQLNDPTAGIARAGQLFDRAVKGFGSIQDDVTANRDANVASQTEANTAKIISEIQGNRDLDSVDQSSADIISGLSGRFDGDVNTGGFDLKAINQAASDHRAELLDTKTSESALVTEGLKQQNEQFDVDNNQKRLNSTLAAQSAQVASSNAQTDLSKLNTRIATARMDKVESDVAHTEALSQTFLNFPILTGENKTATTKDFAQAMSRFRASALKAGTPPDVLKKFFEDTGLIDPSTGSASASGLHRGITLQNKNLEAIIDEDLSTMDGLNGKGEDYGSKVNEVILRQAGGDLDDDELIGFAGEDVLPEFLEIMSDLNSKLPVDSKNQFTMQDVYAAMTSEDVGFSADLIGSGGSMDGDKMRSGLKKAGEKRHAAKAKLQAKIKANQAQQKILANQLITHAYQQAGAGNPLGQ